MARARPVGARRGARLLWLTGAGLLLAAVLAGAALAAVTVTASSSQLGLSTPVLTAPNGQRIYADYDIVVEPFRDGVRTGYRVRPREGQGTGTIDTSDVDCLRNPVVNDVVCSRYSTAIEIDLVGSGDDDRVALREYMVRQDGLQLYDCVPRSELANVSVVVRLGQGADRFSVTGHEGRCTPGENDGFGVVGPGETVDRPWGIDVASLEVDGGSGDDTLGSGVASVARMFGGTGNDQIVTRQRADEADGGSGNDTLDLGEGNDRGVGDSGNDTLDLGDGDDTGFGGTGNDTLRGRAGNDVLHLEDGNDTAVGGAGHDAVHGGAGDDSIQGEDGNDAFTGGAGNDVVDGGLGNDGISGGSGNDQLRGGPGVDTVDGGDGNDVVWVDDDFTSPVPTLDTVDCGAGRDTAYVDSSDDTTNCEGVLRHRYTDGLPSYVTGESVTIPANGNTQFPVRCPSQAGVRCAGTLVVRAAGSSAELARTTYDIAVGQTVTHVLTIPLPRPAALVATTSEQGQTYLRSGTVTLPVVF